MPHAPTCCLLAIDSTVAARLTRRLQWLIVFFATVLALYMATEAYRPYSTELDVLGKLVIALVVGSLFHGMIAMPVSAATSTSHHLA